MTFNFHRLIYFIFVLVIILIASSIIAQNIEYHLKQEISRDSLLTIARKIVKTNRTCTFITVDEEDKPQARTLAYFPPGDDWKIWVGISTNSRKVKQVINNPDVMIFYYDPKGRSYVSIAGIARVVSDSELKKKYWKKGWKKFYPNPEKDYILIEVTPNRLEVCSFKYKLFWDSTGKPAFVDF